MAAGGDRIALLTSGGSVATIRPDGTGLRVVAEATPDRVHQQLGWSPDGSRLAFGRLDRARAGQGHAALVVVGADGEEVSTALATVPFYVAWRPDGRAIACLGNGPAGIDLTLVEPGVGARVLLRGSPLFLAWDPSGARLACHVDDEELVVLDDGGLGAPRPLARVDGFTAPVWLHDGICADVEERGRRRLAVLDPSTGRVVRRIARHDGWSRAIARPGDTRLAFVTAALDRGRDPGVLTEDGEALPGALCVAGSDPRDALDVVTASTPVAAEWSPDGRRLLVLVQDSSTTLQWQVWDGGLGSVPVRSFVPTPTVVRGELPFADQYALSRRSWSPDGAAFTWTARGRDGIDRLWVAHLDPDGARCEVLCEATSCAWSP